MNSFSIRRGVPLLLALCFLLPGNRASAQSKAQGLTLHITVLSDTDKQPVAGAPCLLTNILPTIADIAGVRIPDDWQLDGVSLYPELCGKKPNAKDLVLVHFNPLWPTTPSPKASRYAMDDDYAYFWDGRIYNYREDPEFLHPQQWADASAELQARLQPLKDRVDQMADFYPDKPGAPRKFPYKTFYDFAPPQNPF